MIKKAILTVGIIVALTACSGKSQGDIEQIHKAHDEATEMFKDINSRAASSSDNTIKAITPEATDTIK